MPAAQPPELDARQTIVKQPADLRGKKGAAFLDDLFKNFCAFASSRYSYSATKQPGSEGVNLLKKPGAQAATVDCASLADAFVILAKDALGVNDAALEKVGSADGFATKAGSRCFDAKIVGNMRTPLGTWQQTSRCVFREHWFVRAAGKLFDPCMLTTYASTAEVMSWTFEAAFGAYNGKVLLIKQDPSKFVIRIPTLPGPPGFNSGMLICETKDWDKAEYQAAFKRPKPGWQMVTKSINELLKAARVPHEYKWS